METLTDGDGRGIVEEFLHMSLGVILGAIPPFGFINLYDGRKHRGGNGDVVEFDGIGAEDAMTFGGPGIGGAAADETEGAADFPHFLCPENFEGIARVTIPRLQHFFVVS